MSPIVRNREDGRWMMNALHAGRNKVSLGRAAFLDSHYFWRKHFQTSPVPFDWKRQNRTRVQSQSAEARSGRRRRRCTAKRMHTMLATVQNTIKLAGRPRLTRFSPALWSLPLSEPHKSASLLSSPSNPPGARRSASSSLPDSRSLPLTEMRIVIRIVAINMHLRACVRACNVRGVCFSRAMRPTRLRCTARRYETKWNMCVCVIKLCARSM